MGIGTVTVHWPPAKTGVLLTGVHTTGGDKLGVEYNEAPTVFMLFSHSNVEELVEEIVSVRPTGDRKAMLVLFTPELAATLVKVAVVSRVLLWLVTGTPR